MRDETQQIALLDQAVGEGSGFCAGVVSPRARYILRFYWSNYDHTPARLELGRTALDAAARLQPDAGEVHLTRAFFITGEHGITNRALAELAIARRALPNNADVVYFSGAIRGARAAGRNRRVIWRRRSALDPRNATTLH